MASDSAKQLLILAGIAAGTIGIVKFVNGRGQTKGKKKCGCHHRSELETALRDLELADAIEAQGETVPW